MDEGFHLSSTLPPHLDLLVRGLLLQPDGTVASGAVGVAGGRIAHVGGLGPAPPATETIDVGAHEARRAGGNGNVTPRQLISRRPNRTPPPDPERCSCAACRRWAMEAQSVCATHGGRVPQAKARAERTIREEVEARVSAAIEAFDRCLASDAPLTVQLRAACDLLDRAGYGAVTKVEQTGNGQAPISIVIQSSDRDDHELEAMGLRLLG